MVSLRQTLLDPYEVTGTGMTSPYRPPLSTLDEVTEWFNRTETLDEIAFLEEISSPPPWTPEPTDRRWRARGWGEDSLD
jgi:hypothetical protein